MRRLALVLALATPVAVHAQGVDPATPNVANACFGFSFGRWEPPLDWGKAGHTSPPRVGPGAGASADGSRRDWAADQTDSGRVELVLFPAWWPVGVHVALREAGGDTLRGTATALVADGRARAPVARVAALRIRCGEPAGDRRLPRADDPPRGAPPAARPARPPDAERAVRASRSSRRTARS